MRIAIIGAGPAGLYFAYLAKRLRPDWDIRVFEQNACDATYGFGVVFSERALEFLDAGDRDTFAAIASHLESWRGMVLDIGGRRIAIDGIGFAAIGRLKLLGLLRERAGSVGVRPAYKFQVTSLDEIGDADLVVGADGVNSLIRRCRAREFGSSVEYLTNRFIWLGTTRLFATLTQTFRKTVHGCFNAHHYRHAPDRSTFLVETDETTFRRAGLATMPAAQSLAVCEAIFADVLDGHRLISDSSTWRQFPKIRCEQWFGGKFVLIGDALHTAHFSIGSGTRLAMEDALALADALSTYPSDIEGALACFAASRRPAVEALVAAADRSADWYEGFAARMALAPMEFAMSYAMRSGRIDLARLEQVSPEFVAQYRDERRRRQRG
jgi:2-polyprenyl-6-methoxyphenol hydroxylase-like FAD-dependent oxidoreductase